MTAAKLLGAISATLILLAPPLRAQSAPRVDPPGTAPRSERTLRPGDIVQLDIWREPDMSGKYRVDENGQVVLPRLGTLDVLSETPESLETEVRTEYEKYLRNPSIDVTVLRRVRILGSVEKPGVYPVDPTITVADALAMAGGITPEGEQDEVRIVRNGQELQTRVSQQTRIADSPIRSGDQLYVPERSWFSRNSNVVASGIAATVSLFIALVLR